MEDEISVCPADIGTLGHLHPAHTEGRIPGAVRIGYAWAIPDDEPKPKDARIKSGKYIKNMAPKE